MMSAFRMRSKGGRSMRSAMELRAAPVRVTPRAVQAPERAGSSPRRWPTFLLAALLTGVAVILNATLVGAVAGVPLFLLALSLFTSPAD
jgi:hypothetical protein